MPVSERKSASGTMDVIALLTADHQKLKQLFLEFQNLKERGATAEKEELVQEICAELIIHAELEEEVFYPAAREVLNDDVLVDEAESEHTHIKDMIEELQAVGPAHPGYNAKVTVLGENVERHIAEEQTVMFSRIKKTRLDLAALAEELLALRESKQNQLIKGNGSLQQNSSRSARF